MRKQKHHPSEPETLPTSETQSNNVIQSISNPPQRIGRTMGNRPEASIASTAPLGSRRPASASSTYLPSDVASSRALATASSRVIRVSCRATAETFIASLPLDPVAVILRVITLVVA